MTLGNTLAAAFNEVRARSRALAQPLSAEDAQVQSMPDASPAKWHLAHTTWFFEAFVLDGIEGFTPHHPQYAYLFNSYYEAVGPRHTRAARGVLSRPSLDEVMDYRRATEAAVLDALAKGQLDERRMEVLILGLHHEQQHQELLLTDIKHALSCNAMSPVYRERADSLGERVAPESGWIGHAGGVVEVGHRGEGFAFDNEGPRHRVFLEPFEMARRLVTNADYLAFIEAGGYGEARWWLSPGWDTVQREAWEAPLYWRRADGADGADVSAWREFTLHGERELDLHAPVVHLSYYEADAFARWAGARLPTEFEWEAFAEAQEAAFGAGVADGHFVESGDLHPRGQLTSAPGLRDAARAFDLFGSVWEWTSSAYSPYPGFSPAEGAVGEYNGKFMVAQQVLRGGSLASAASHLRPSYRNFFHAPDRWQFMGLRLARSVG